MLWATVALLVAFGTTPAAALSPFESETVRVPTNQVDVLVFDQLNRLHIEPANVCSDAVFVRRVYLDVIGTLPTATEAYTFIQDKKADKRRALIDRLLEREEFADYWAMKWSDLLRVKAEFPINLWPNAAQAYHRWIRTSIKENIPYDAFARELLTASGSNFRVGAVNFYRAMQNHEPAGIAQTVGLTLMGQRAWTTNQLAGMAAFFAQVGYKSTGEWKEEIIYFDPTRDTNGLAKLAAFPDGTRVTLSDNKDPREVFAQWLIDTKNPWFTRNVVNRLWSWLLGRGIIHEPDDIRPDNLPSNPRLLAFLEKELIGAQYDLKHLFRLILNSKTYQLSSIPKTDRPEAAANFASYPIRRLDAEVLIDALNQITGTTEKYTSPIPEPFTFIPEDQRSIALPDGSISSSFLELFGRPARDTGLEAERNNKPSAGQKLHLLNSSHIQRKLETSQKLRSAYRPGNTPKQTVSGIYLMILSRLPTEQEVQIAETYTHSGTVKGNDVIVDLSWALVNSAEFLYRH